MELGQAIEIRKYQKGAYGIKMTTTKKHWYQILQDINDATGKRKN